MPEIDTTIEWIILIAAGIAALAAITKRTRTAIAGTYRTILRLLALRDLMDQAEALTRIVKELEGDDNGSISLRDFVAHTVNEKLEPIREEQQSMRYAMTDGFAAIQVALDEIKNGPGS